MKAMLSQPMNGKTNEEIVATRERAIMDALERAKVLLKATRDILEKCDDSFYVLNALEVTAVWDGVECDGYCLKNDIDEFFEELADGVLR